MSGEWEIAYNRDQISVVSFDFLNLKKKEARHVSWRDTIVSHVEFMLIPREPGRIPFILVAGFNVAI
jgi:hypothetical protein